MLNYSEHYRTLVAPDTGSMYLTGTPVALAATFQADSEDYVTSPPSPNGRRRLHIFHAAATGPVYRAGLRTTDGVFTTWEVASAMIYYGVGLASNAYRDTESVVAFTGANVVWTSAVNASASGNTLTKTGGVGWVAGAVSEARCPGNCYVYFTLSLGTFCGLSVGDTDQNYTDIDFAIYATAVGNLHVYESGILAQSVGTHTATNRPSLSCCAYAQ